jgi:hypothetical protein
MRDLWVHADRAIYVLIAVLAVSVALEDTNTDAGHALAAVAGTAIALTLAELFAGRIGISLREHRRPSPGESRVEMHAALTGLAVASLPTFFLLLAVLDVIALHRAFTVTQWTGFGVIGVYTYLASRASGNPQLRSVVGGLGLLAIGGGLILLNSVVK